MNFKKTAYPIIITVVVFLLSGDVYAFLWKKKTCLVLIRYTCTKPYLIWVWMPIDVG